MKNGSLAPQIAKCWLAAAQPRLPLWVAGRVVLVVPQQGLHGGGAAGTIQHELISQRLLRTDVFEVAGTGLPLMLSAGQADEPVDGGLAGGLVGSPLC
jgi:hypothetical protein